MKMLQGRSCLSNKLNFLNLKLFPIYKKQGIMKMLQVGK
jgi:hypothetical protein